MSSALSAGTRPDQRDLERQIVRAETVARLAGGVVHNFNNLLAVLLGRVELMLGQVEAGRLEPRQIKQALLSMHRAALDAAELLKRLRDLTRPPQAMAFETLDLDAVARDAMDFIQPHVNTVAQTRGVALRLVQHASAVPALIEGQASALVEVLVNLILNAVEAMPAGGDITLETEVTEGAVLLRVRDTGVGMPDEVAARAFTPFFTTKAGGSTGLGLSSARELVHRHGGHIGLESQVGRGTTVTVTFSAARLRREAGGPPAPAALPPGLAVLVVEDEADFGDILQEFLGGLGCRVTVVAGARAALAALETASYDVVVADVLLPDGSGWDVARRARACQPEAAVIAMTGRLGPEEGGAALPVAVDALLTKPLDLWALARAIAARVAPGSAAGC
jgi:CheY-like chemotaxis protein/anti-sigma regulatory factor (Ser/Thr protein kinase)